MKGGITSGIVYPLAVVEISKGFRLKNIGGTSAGAIAAAAAAAAEYARYRGSNSGFDSLANLPQFLGRVPPRNRHTNLFGFFQPQETTAALFRTLTAGLGGGKAAFVRVFVAAVGHFWKWFVFGAAPGAFVAWRSFQAPDFAGIATWIAIVTATLGGGTIAMIAGLVSALFIRVPKNDFGLCSGMPGKTSGGSAALTPWLTAYLNELAGKAPDSPPLTFGELWNVDTSDDDRTINLEMMTTCLTHGRPYRLPFRDDEAVHEGKQFYWRADEFARFFPKHVIDHLKAHARSPLDAGANGASDFVDSTFIPLPSAQYCPVVVAVRMSLSFPVLLSAVPLYSVDHSLKTEPHNEGTVTSANPRTPKPERCWFSDGGISSNFPIHFFDSVLPRWPTFGIDLTEKHPQHDPGFYMPRTNAAGTLVRWTRLDDVRPSRKLLRFAAQIVSSAKDWSDNMQVRLPGFRDRIGQIGLESNDGGLNLNMPPHQIERLANYGRLAGLEFVERFTSRKPECPLDWANHRRVRLRSSLAAIEEWLVGLTSACDQPEPGDPSYSEFLATDDFETFRWRSKAQRGDAAELLRRLKEVADWLADSRTESPTTGAPRPRPELRLRPRI
jgi:predicted acylesterase/phospholipase RssA